MRVKSKVKFSTLINEFTYIWLMWMIWYNKSIDAALPFRKRRQAGEKCEKLIKRRYELIEELNGFFDKKQK